MSFVESFRPCYEILLRPSGWRATTAAIDPALPSDYSLIELKAEHWRNATLRRLLVAGFLSAPGLLFALLLLGLFLLGLPLAGSLTAFSFVFIVALVFATLISVAAGIVILPIVGTIAGSLWVGESTLMIDMIVSLRYGLLFGLSCGLTVAVISHLSGPTTGESRWRQIGGVVLGLVASAVVMAISTALLLGLISGRQSGFLPGVSIGWLVAFIPTLLLGIAAFLQTRSWRKTLLVSALTALLVAFAFGDIGYEFSRQIGGTAQLIGLSANTLAMFFVVTTLPYVMVRRFVGPWPAAIAAAIGGLVIYPLADAIFTIHDLWGNLLLAIAFLLGGLTFGWLWSLAAYLLEAGWNTLLLRLDSRRVGTVHWLRYHAVFWGEIQRLPFFELADYLVLATERDAAQGEALIRSIQQSRQQWAAQQARIELDARRLEGLTSVAALATTSSNVAAGLLATPAGLMLRNFAQLGSDVAAALAQPSPYNQQLVLGSVARDLESLQSELARNGADRLARRYAAVAQHWHRVVSAHIAKLEADAKANQEIPNPYIVGVPLTRRQELFVGRTDVARYVEDILRVGDHPPILLYGPRRMGKTSLLYQLNWMLPRRILPLVVDLQGPVSLASNHVGFLHALARGIRLAAARNEITLPDLPRSALEQEPFTVFDEWLTQIGSVIANDQREAILFALDEFEALDAAFRAGTLEERAILGMLRHIVQHRRGVKLLLAGSHTLAEFRRWSSYLINAQVVELSYLEASEARRLIETPIPDFPLGYEAAAVQHLLDLTRGHPYLVQLLCMEIVALKNRQPPAQRHRATVADVEAAVPATLERGQQFFADIELNQMDEAGRALLRWLAQQGAGYGATVELLAATLPEVPHPQTMQQLVQRNLLQERNGAVSFAVEVVRRWFAQVE
jgi:hypothetical protein